MASYTQTLVAFIIFAVIVVLGTLVFAAIEESSYQDGFALSVQIVTTIGYGNVPPATVSGKVFCIFYTLIGIPVNIVLLQKIGEHMVNLQKFVISRIEWKIFKREAKYVAYKSLAVCIIGIIVLIMLGALIQVYSENWSFLDGVYCYVITFTTVGFGDFIPGFKSNRVATRVLMCMFTLIGLCVMSTTISAAIDCNILASLSSICTKKSVANTEDKHDTEIEAEV